MVYASCYGRWSWGKLWDECRYLFDWSYFKLQILRQEHHSEPLDWDQMFIKWSTCVFLKILPCSTNLQNLVKRLYLQSLYIGHVFIYLFISFVFLLVWEIGSLGLITSSLLLQEGPNEIESLRTKLSSQKGSKLLKSGSLIKGNPASFHPDAAEKH